MTAVNPVATASCASAVTQRIPAVLAFATAAVLYGGWYFLWEVARRYPTNPNSYLRATGAGLKRAAVGSAFALFLLFIWTRIHRDSCDNTVSWEANLGMWLFLGTVVLFMLGTAMATAATEWVAIAAITVADYGLMVLYSGLNNSHRPAILVLLGVHGTCTAVTAVWSRRVRGGAQAIRAKGSEAGRMLASGWIVIVLLAIASFGHPVSTMLPDSTFAGLFVVTSISLVMGTGYTKYAEAKQSLCERQGPPSDLISALGAWLHRYSEWF